MARFFGTIGDDTIVGSAADDVIRGGPAANPGGDRGDDLLLGEGGFDVIYGGAGDDEIRLGPDGGRAIGDKGDDLILLADGGGARGGGGDDTIRATEDASRGINAAADKGDDLLVGSAFQDFLNGGEGRNTLLGGGGDDVLGSAGEDSIDGGDGDDRLFLDLTGLADIVLRFAGAASVTTIAGRATIAGVERIEVRGGDGRDLIDLSRAAAATIAGGAGADTLIGGEGDDEFSVNDFDIVEGNGGDDVFLLFGPGQVDGGAGTDRARIFGDLDEAALFVFRGPGFTTALADGGTLSGIERIEFGAGNGNDTLDLSRAVEAASLYGGGGDDLLIGGGGDDLITGLDGENTIHGGGGRDSIFGEAASVTGGAGDDSIYAGSAVGARINHVFGGAGDDLLVGATDPFRAPAEDRFAGGAGDDRLLGGSGADLLRGGAGDDQLNGGNDADRLVGGTGADAFRFLAPDDGVDTLVDFITGLDRIEVEARQFGGGLVRGLDIAATGRFVVGAEATAGFGQFVFDTATGVLAWDADGAGGDAAVAFALVANTTPTAADIVVV